MIVQYMSDLHLEFAKMPVPDVAGDVLVLAGDIHVGANAIPWIEQCALAFKDVIYILGNHEYYGQDMWKLPGKIQDSINGKGGLFDPLHNVHFLNNDSIVINGVKFIGSTLWSDGNPMLQYKMNDFSKINYKYTGSHGALYGKLSVEEAANIHQISKQLIKNAIDPKLKNVVITHHAPSFEMINMIKYGDSFTNTGFATEILGEFDPKHISVWISGHTHWATSKVINGIPSVSNCRGYVPYEPVENFNPCATVEI